MNFRLFNYTQGVVSLVSWTRPFPVACREVMELASRRADEEGVSLDAALAKSFQEHMVGLFGFTGVSVALLALTLGLAGDDSAPDWVLFILAVLPSFALIAVLRLEAYMRKRWSI